MTGRKIIVGISGSIAAYKSAFLVRELVKAGHEVKVVMTPAATAFVSALTLSTLSKNEVHIDVIDENSWNNHVELGLWADLMIVAPATANTIAKMTYGLCDNMLLATYLSAKCPVWVCPAMDLDMWRHTATQTAISKLSSFPGLTIVPVGTGELASGLHGPGRMAEPLEIIERVNQWFAVEKQLTGKRFLITCGPTREAIDPVRFISNPSTGTMGFELAKEVLRRGGHVDLVSGPTHHQLTHANLNTIHVTSAAEMLKASEAFFKTCDVAIFAAAVSDYTPVISSEVKLKKQPDDLDLRLKRTEDIAATFADAKRPHQISIGFALETDDEVKHAKDKLARKSFNFIVLNSLRDEGAGFGDKTNKVTIFDDQARKEDIPLSEKRKVAQYIIDHYSKHYLNEHQT